MAIDDNKQLCDLHDLRLNKLEQKVDKNTDKIESVENRVGQNENQNARQQEIMSNFDKKFEHLEKTLNGMADDVKAISETLTAVKTRSDLNDKNMKKNLKGHLKNNKELYAIITGLMSIIGILAKALL